MNHDAVDGALSDAHVSRKAAHRYAVLRGLAEVKAAGRYSRRARRTPHGRVTRGRR